MTHHDAFLESILAAPDDDAPRLIYADWLEENGEPERAEFIRVQIALEDAACTDNCEERWNSTPDYRRCVFCEGCSKRRRLIQRERELRSEKSSALDWLHSGDIEWNYLSPVLRRGFVEVVSLTCADWLEHGPAIVRAAPIREVRLTDKAPESVSSILRAMNYAEIECRKWSWNISLSFGAAEASVLPERLLVGGKHENGVPRWHIPAPQHLAFDSVKDALKWLSDACIAYACAALKAPVVPGNPPALRQSPPAPSR